MEACHEPRPDVVLDPSPEREPSSNLPSALPHQHSRKPGGLLLGPVRSRRVHAVSSSAGSFPGGLAANLGRNLTCFASSVCAGSTQSIVLPLAQLVEHRDQVVHANPVSVLWTLLLPIRGLGFHLRRRPAYRLL